MAKRVLIVEDTESIRLALKGALRLRKFEVFDAVDGQSGLDLYRQLDPKPDLVITDQQMPNLCGVELATLILMEQPQQRILLQSGFSSVEVPIGVRFVRKMTTQDELITIIFEMLELPGTGAIEEFLSQS